MRRLAISDIHGCLRTFEALLAQVAFTKEDTLYLLGDYVDRGPDSKGVIDAIWSMQAAGYQIHCLCGNHEQIVVSDFDEQSKYPYTPLGDWYFLNSFQAANMSQIPTQYIDWMRNLPLYFETPGYILVHAGLDFETEDPFSSKKALTWIRDWYTTIDRDWLGNRIIVHGHTPNPVQNIVAYPLHYDRLPVQAIDAGCFAKKSKALGNLCCFDLDTHALYFEANIDV